MANKILIIEDDIFLGDVLLQKLGAAGYETVLARDGASGLRQLREHKPDLVLLDVILPQMNGYELLAAKQKDPSIAAIPVIMISNSGQPVEINRALVLGVKDYIVKAHFDPQEVVDKVRLQLGTSLGDTTLEVKAGGVSTSASPKGPKLLIGRKILLVEDDKFLSDIIVSKLTMQGCEVMRLADGREAITMLEKMQPDLILLDIRLPGVDGFEMLRRIKSTEAIKNIPVIFLSNLGQKEDIEKGKALGAARFLVKAMVTLDEIIEEIKSVLAKSAGKQS